MIVVVHLISAALILSGLVFAFGASVGILRFPDFYSRVHAAGKGDTLSALLILGGFALEAAFQGGFSFLNFLIALKIIAVAGFIFLTSPTSTHALIQAGFDDGAKPITDERPEDAVEKP